MYTPKTSYWAYDSLSRPSSPVRENLVDMLRSSPYSPVPCSIMGPVTSPALINPIISIVVRPQDVLRCEGIVPWGKNQ